MPGLNAPALVRAALLEVAGGDLDPAVSARAARWGARHRLAPWRAVPANTVAESRSTETGPELGGDHDCVLATSSVPGVTDLCRRGPAARYSWDLARREDSCWVVPLGADGVPGSTHDDDQLAAWRRGELLPVVTDWNKLTEERNG